MFKPNRSQGRPPSSPRKNTSAKLRKALRRVIDSLLLTVLAVVAVYLVMLVVKVNRGYSQTQGGAERVARLQIVDGSGEKGLVKQARKLVAEVSDSQLAVEIVESERFERSPVARSFLIAREEDRTSAEILARKLGLEEDDITYRPLENNRQHVTLTLVLGANGLPALAAEDT
jgi:hypothetical protein